MATQKYKYKMTLIEARRQRRMRRLDPAGAREKWNRIFDVWGSAFIILLLIPFCWVMSECVTAYTSLPTDGQQQQQTGRPN